jgi:Fic family protein
MHSLSKEYIKSIKLDASHAKTISAIGVYKGREDLFTRQFPETLKSLKKVAKIESVDCSNQLEGIVIDRKRVDGIVLETTNPSGRDEQEFAGYRDALNHIHQNWEVLDFDINTIKSLHSIIFKYLPDEEGGRWKEKMNLIVEETIEGVRVRHTPVTPEKTPGAMDLLVERYHRALQEGNAPLVIIPLAIFDFLSIHPFWNGNGRVARLLTLLLLYKAGYKVGRYISIERIYKESGQSYYETLEMSSQGWHEGKHDIMPWLTYFWGVLIKAYKEFEERVGTVNRARGSKTAQIKLVVDRQIRPFSISDIERECADISREMIRKVLQDLRDEGKLRLEGVGRGAKWAKVQEGSI